MLKFDGSSYINDFIYLMEEVSLQVRLVLIGQFFFFFEFLEMVIGYNISLTWLTKNMNYGLIEDSPFEYKIQCTRRYILWLIDGFLLPNSTGYYVHNYWLPLLADFEQTKTYSWG
jgi:hypothetical protein